MDENAPKFDPTIRQEEYTDNMYHDDNKGIKMGNWDLIGEVLVPIRKTDNPRGRRVYNGDITRKDMELSGQQIYWLQSLKWSS